MAKNDFKPFAIGEYSNVMSQEEYEALPAVGAGFNSGIAKSEQLNKVWRQSSVMAAVLGDFVGEQSGDDVIDDGNLARLKASLTKALFNYNTGSLDTRYVKQTGDVMSGDLHVETNIEVDGNISVGGNMGSASVTSPDITVSSNLKVDGLEPIKKSGSQVPVNNERITTGLRINATGDMLVDLFHLERMGNYHLFGVHVAGGGGDGWFEFRSDGSIRASGGVFDSGQRVYSPNNKPDELHVDGDRWWSRDSSGKITQGGIVNRSANSNPVTFPIPFPNGVLGVQLTLREVNSSGGSTDNIIAQNANKAGFNVWMNSNELSAYWEATGY